MQWLIEQAKEEAEMLEQQHPNKYKCLKKELTEFISELEVQNQTTTVSIYADTQESSSNKRERVKRKRRRRRRMSRTDAVIERAQQCLHKIQHLKATLS